MASSSSNINVPSTKPANNPTQNLTSSSSTKPTQTRARSVSKSGRFSQAGIANTKGPDPYSNIAAKINTRSNHTPPNWRSPRSPPTRSSSRRPSTSTTLTNKQLHSAPKNASNSPA